MNKVICILVLYNPDLEILKKAITAVINQVDFLWISDNTPGVYLWTTKYWSDYAWKIKYVSMGENVGIAKAQNVGIKFAIENKFKYVFFLDQDSIAPDGIVDGLRIECEELLKSDINVGGCGPVPFNRDTGKQYCPNIEKGKLLRKNIYEVSRLINSASLIRIEVFEQVGLMSEKLFIDFVDDELCWRASQLSGFRFFKITTLLLSHKLGEGDRHFCGITVKISKPFRTYFQYRNYFYLLSKNYVPIYWKLSMGVKYTGKFCYYLLFCHSRLDYFNKIRKGIFDGIKAYFNGL